MTRKNAILISLIIVTLLISAGFLAMSIWRQAQYDASSRDFAVYITPLILSANPIASQTAEDDEVQGIEAPEVIEAEMAWEKYAHSSLLQQQSNQDRSKFLFVVTRYLGALEAIESLSGGSEVPLPLIGKTAIRADYSLDVGFSAGDAEVKLSLIYEGKDWLITNFEVISNILAD